MTIMFRPLNDGQYRAACYSTEATYEESQRAVAAIESTGCNCVGFPVDKLPVVVAALRLSGFEVK